MVRGRLATIVPINFLGARATQASGHSRAGKSLNCHPAVLTSPNPLSTFQKQFACARFSRSCCRDHRPSFSATLTTMDFGHSRSRWLGIGYLMAVPKGPPSSLAQLGIAGTQTTLPCHTTLNGHADKRLIVLCGPPNITNPDLLALSQVAEISSCSGPLPIRTRAQHCRQAHGVSTHKLCLCQVLIWSAARPVDHPVFSHSMQSGLSSCPSAVKPHRTATRPDLTESAPCLAAFVASS